MMLKPGTFLYDLPASKRAAADAPDGIFYGAVMGPCRTDPFAPYRSDGSGDLPAQAECGAIGTGPDVNTSDNALTTQSSFDYPEKTVDALVGTYTHPAYELTIPTGDNNNPSSPGTNNCYATILADGTVTRQQTKSTDPRLPLCPNVHISVSG